ncbi:MAG: two pore domain potassium channel family protein [Planctomycetes bacterium]|nr:two pore domain potassium channel family protein [Planctomycetota bacterium]
MPNPHLPTPELTKLSEDKSYRRAIEKLFKRSQHKHKEIRFFEMPWYRRLYNCFYFSVVTFTTLGYGDINPIGSFKIAIIIESILGSVTIALFLVTLANVWLR